MVERLALLAADDADLAAISALVQDMAVRAADIGFDRRARRLLLIGNRYRWEARDRTRVRAAIRIDGVTALERRHWPRLPATVLALLALRREEGRLLLDFASGPALRVGVEAIDLMLEDLSGPWRARAVPRHDTP